MKIKVRQISQGVEDFKWKDIKARNADAAKDIDIDEEPPVADDSGETNGVPIDTDVQPTEPTTDGKVHEDSTPPLSATAIDPAPPTSADDTAPPPATTGSSNHLSAEPNLRRDSDSDSSEKEKGLKRKFLERGTSQGPQENGPESSSETLKRARDDAGNDVNPRETKRPSPPPEADKASEPLKRPRDDADQDANPREAKRPSPPPEKDTPAAPPKFVCSIIPADAHSLTFWMILRAVSWLTRRQALPLRLSKVKMSSLLLQKEPALPHQWRRVQRSQLHRRSQLSSGNPRSHQQRHPLPSSGLASRPSRRPALPSRQPPEPNLQCWGLPPSWVDQSRPPGGRPLAVRMLSRHT